MEEVQYENDNYKVIVTDQPTLPIFETIYPKTCYQIVNKLTNVVEAEDIIMVVAFSKADHYNKELISFDAKKDNVVKLTLN